MIRKLLKDMHTGKDGLYSQRSVLGTCGFIFLCVLSSISIYKDVSTSTVVLPNFTVLVSFLLGMKTWQNNQENKIDKGV